MIYFEFKKLVFINKLSPLILKILQYLQKYIIWINLYNFFKIMED